MALATPDDVQLCLRLYEQRRDPALREARDWMNQFVPSSFEEIRAVMFGEAGPDANRCWRQAGSYWEMISAIMLSGGVSEAGRELFMKTTREFLFCFSKVEPFLAEIRAATQPTAFSHLEQLCRSMPDYERFLNYFRSVNDRRRAMLAAAAKPKGRAKSKPAPKKKGAAKRR